MHGYACMFIINLFDVYTNCIHKHSILNLQSDFMDHITKSKS